MKPKINNILFLVVNDLDEVESETPFVDDLIHERCHQRIKELSLLVAQHAEEAKKWKAIAETAQQKNSEIEKQASKIQNKKKYKLKSFA